MQQQTQALTLSDKPIESSVRWWPMLVTWAASIGTALVGAFMIAIVISGERTPSFEHKVRLVLPATHPGPGFSEIY